MPALFNKMSRRVVDLVTVSAAFLMDSNEPKSSSRNETAAPGTFPLISSMAALALFSERAARKICEGLCFAS